MTLEQLRRFVDALNSYHMREEQLSKAVEPFNSSWTMIEFCPLITKCIFDYIKEVFNDEGEWFGYWFYELEQGKNSDRLKAYNEKGDQIVLNTLEDVYRLLVSAK